MSTLRTDTLQNAAGSKSVPVNTVVDGSAKAWVNFNGTGTVAIRASFNVTSITDNGTGAYTVNFTTAMPDANYSTVLTPGTNFNGYARIGSAPTTGSVGITTIAQSGPATADSDYVNVAIFR